MHQFPVSNDCLVFARYSRHPIRSIEDRSVGRGFTPVGVSPPGMSGMSFFKCMTVESSFLAHCDADFFATADLRKRKGFENGENLILDKDGWVARRRGVKPLPTDRSSIDLGGWRESHARN